VQAPFTIESAVCSRLAETAASLGLPVHDQLLAVYLQLLQRYQHLDVVTVNVRLNAGGNVCESMRLEIDLDDAPE